MRMAIMRLGLHPCWITGAYLMGMAAKKLAVSANSGCRAGGLMFSRS
jgi:hypothetical protein